MPAKVFDEGGGRRQHTVRIKHELGFSIMLTDVGEVLDKDEQDKALERLKGSVVATYHDVKGATLAVRNPHLLNFSNAYGSGITIHYTVHEGDRRFRPHMPSLRAQRPDVHRHLSYPVSGHRQERRHAANNEDAQIDSGVAIRRRIAIAQHPTPLAAFCRGGRRRGRSFRRCAGDDLDQNRRATRPIACFCVALNVALRITFCTKPTGACGPAPSAIVASPFSGGRYMPLTVMPCPAFLAKHEPNL